ncbi:hypothetical protein EBZ39_02375, partial [bacterium]|nr:hypothetical protein [bacterium]
MRIKDTSPSGASSGGLVVAGSIATANTDITGEVSVNDTKMTPNKDDIVYEREYTVPPNQNAWVNVPGFSFDSSRTRSFQANVKANTPTASTLYELNGLYKATGWAFNYTFTGDLLPLQFAVVDFSGVGQVQVKNPSADQVELRFRAATTAIKDTTPIVETVGLITGGNSRFSTGAFIIATATGGLESTPGTLQFDKNSFKITTPMEVNSQSTVTGTAGAALQVGGGVSVAKGVRTNVLAVGATRANTALNVQGDIHFTEEFLQDRLPFDKSLFEQSGGNIFYNTAGNVGIRTTAPTTSFDVVGTGKVSGAVTLGNIFSSNVKSAGITAGSVHVTGRLTGSTLTMGNVVTADTLAVGGTLVAASVAALNVIDTRVTTGNLNFTTAQVNDIAFKNAHIPLTTIGTADVTNVSTVNVSLDNVMSTNINVSGGVTASAVRSQSTTTDTLNTNTSNTQFLQVTQTISGGDIRNALGITDAVNANVSTLVSGDIRVLDNAQSERLFANTVDVTDTIVSSANIHTVVTPIFHFTSGSTGSLTSNTVRGTSLQTGNVQNDTAVTVGNLQSTSISTGPLTAAVSTTAANLRSNIILGDHLTAQSVDANNTLVADQVNASQDARVGQLTLSTLTNSSTMTGGIMQVSGDINAGNIRSSTVSTDMLTTRNIELTNVSTSTIRQDTVTTGSLQVNFSASIATVNANNATHTQTTMTNLAATGLTTPNFVVPGSLTLTNVGAASVSGTNLVLGTSNVSGMALTTGTFGNLAGGQVVSGTIRSTNATVSNMQTGQLSTSTVSASDGVLAANVFATSSIAAGDSGVFSGTIGQLIATDARGVSSVLGGAITANNVVVSSTVSTGTLGASTSTLASARVGSVVSDTLHVPGTIGADTILVDTISSSSLSGASNATIGNLVSVTATVGNYLGTSISTGQLGVQQATLSNLVGASASVTNAVIPGVSTGTLTANVTVGGVAGLSSQFTTLASVKVSTTNITGGSLSASGTLSTESLATGDTTIGTLANTRTTAGTVVVSTLITTSTATMGSITVTSSGNVGISATAPQFTLDVSGTARISEGVSTGTVIATNVTTTNAVVTGQTTLDSALFSVASVTGGLVNGTVASVASVITPVAVASTASATSGVLSAITGTSGCVSNTLVTPNVVVSGSMGASNLIASTTSVLFTLTTTNMTAPSVIVPTATFDTMSSTLLSASTITGGSMSISGNVNIAGGLIVGTITAANLKNTNVTAGTANVGQLIAIGGTNTIGSITTTAGNVGINTTAPAFALDVPGTARVTTGVTTSTLTATGVSTGTLFGGTAAVANVFGTTVSAGSVLVSAASTGFTSLLATTSINTGSVGAALAQHSTISVTGVSAGSVTLQSLAADTLVSSSNLVATSALTATRVNASTLATSTAANISSATVNAAIATDTVVSSGLVTDAQTVSLRATDISAQGVNSSTTGVTNVLGTSGSFSNVAAGLLTTGNVSATNLQDGNLLTSTVVVGTVASTVVSTANVITTSGMTIGNLAFTSGTGLTASVSSARAGVVAATGGISTANVAATTANLVGLQTTSASVIGFAATSGSLTTANATSVTAGVLQGNTQVSFGSARAGTVSSATLFVTGLSADALLASTSVSTGTVSANSNNTIGSLVASTFTITSGNVGNVQATSVSVVASSVTAGTVLAGTLNAPNAAFTNVSAGTITANTVNAVNINFGSLSSNGVAYSASQWTTTAANIFYTAGNVGINTTAPQFTLDLAGTARVSSGLTTGNVNFTGSITQNGVPFASAKWVTSGTSLFNSAGNVAIGTSTASVALDVSGGVRVTNAVTAANVVVTGYINTYGNTVHTTAGTAYTVNLQTLSNRARTSRATANNAVSSWTTRASAASNTWSGVVWSPELGLFVAVSSSGTSDGVMTSPDGINWTTRATATNPWNAIAWSSELSLFVAVADQGTGNDRVMTSPDGINWTTRAGLSGTQWCSVVWSPELSLFVAVAYTGNVRVMTSSDGITWTTRTSEGTNAWRSVTWSPELSLFVAVASSGTGNRVMTSSNGLTWTTRSSAADNSWYGIAWSPELSLFVAVSITGTGNRVMTSPDGFVWTTRASAVDNDWRSVIWSPELSLFVAVAASGTGNRLMTSSDGIVWTTRSSAADNDWYSAAWSPELSRFVAVAATGSGNRVMTSQIALSASRSTPLISPAYLTVTEGNVNLVGTLTLPSTTRTGLTVATVAVTNTVTSGGVFSTNASVGTLLRGTTTSMANVRVSGGVTAANVTHTNATVGTITSTFSSIGTVLVTSNVTTGNFGGTVGSFDTVTASTIGAAVISGVDAQVTGNLALGGALTTTRITASNIVNTNITTSTAVVGNMAAQGMSITSYPLTSSVSLAYTLRVDGAGTEANTAITNAPDGSIYVAGYSVSTTASFYATDGTTVVGTMAGTGKVGYVAKYTPTGSLQYTLRIDGADGTSDGENNSAITIDASGNLYVAGYSQSSPIRFYATDGTTIVQTMANPNTNTATAYVAKYNSSGAFQYTLRIDNTVNEYNTAIATDASGSVYVAGWSSSSSPRFYATDGTTIVQTMANLGSTVVAYIAKYSSAGALQYTLRIDGVGTTEEYNYAIATDIAGNVYIGGYSNGTIASFYATDGTTVVATMANAGGASGTYVGYVAKYNSSGALQYTLRIDGTSYDYINAINTDSSNNVYVAGWTQSSPIRFYATDGTTIVSTTSSLGRSGYIAKYSSSGALQYTLRIDGSGSGTEANTAITTDASGNVYVTGYSNSTAARFYATDGVTIVQTMANASTSGNVGYIAKYSSAGALQYTLRIDGNNNEYNTSVTTATDGSVYIAGYSDSTIASFYATDGTTIVSTMANTATSGSAVAYIAKYVEAINYTGYVLSTTGGVAIGKVGLSASTALDVSGTVRATNIVTGAVTASSGRVTNLSTTTLTTTSNIRVSTSGTVATVNAQATSVSAANVLATSAAIDNFVTPSGQVDSLFVSDTRLPGSISATTVNAPTVRGTNVSATTATLSLVNAQAFGVTNASVGTLSFSGLASTSGAFGTINFANTLSNGTLLVTGTAQATSAAFAVASTGTIAGGEATIANMFATTGNLTSLGASSITVTRLVGTAGSFSTLASADVTLTTLTAGSVSFTTIGSTNVFAGNATISNLLVSGGTLVAAQVTGLSGTNAFIGSGIATTVASSVVTTGGLQATDGVFTSTNTTNYVASTLSNPTTQSNVLVTNSLNSTEGRFTQLTGTGVFVGSATTATLTVPFDVTVGNINYTNSLLVGGVSVATRWAMPSGSQNLVTTSGNVGINTTTPQHRLDVTGNARVTGAVTTSNVALSQLAQNGSPVSLVSQWATRGSASAAVYGNGEIGGNLAYTLLIDGTREDQPLSIATAGDGSVYVTGYYFSTQANLYATDGTTVVQTLGNLSTTGGARAGFIAKYNSSGALQYTLRIDGTAYDSPVSIATAGDGSVYVTGYYQSTQANLYATDGTTILATLGNLSTAGTNVGFIAKYNSSGVLGYTLRIDGTAYDSPQSITTASDGSVYVTGYYSSTQANLYATDGTTILATLGNLSTAGTSAGFISKYNSSGALQYTLRIDGTGDDSPVSIATAGDGSVYVTGYYLSTQANLYATDGTTIVQTLGN